METVAPHAGAWIETSIARRCRSSLASSHPTRVRGLKHESENPVTDLIESHPTRVRGLKLDGEEKLLIDKLVAPHAGAWIETHDGRLPTPGLRSSHPTRVRGLKPGVATDTPAYYCVAPHAGAWIETFSYADVLKNRDVAPHAGAWIETRLVP